MPTPRKQQICLSDTPYYHCISRCVRRTFLCGIDSTTGKDYSHRKQWMIERLALLSNTFAIDVCAYAILSNHSHTVLKINESLAQSWTDEQVMQRWPQGFSSGFHTFIGPEDKLQALCQKQTKHWDRGIKACRKLFKTNRLCPGPT